MTIIAYHKDTLCADQLVLRYADTAKQRFSRKPKIFLSKCKTFAYAVCGSVLTSKEDGSLEMLLLVQLAAASDEAYFFRNGMHDRLQMISNAFEKLTKFLDKTNTHIIAMTKDEVYYINRSGAELIENDDFACAGSAEHVFTALMHEDPVELTVAFEIMSNIEPTVSREFDVITRDQLKPMHRMKDKKK
jgi:hypothetical protein